MNKFNNKKNIFVLLCMIIILSFFSIKSTYAKFIQGYTTPEDIVDYSYDLDFNIKSYSDEDNFDDDKSYGTLEEYEVVSVKAHGYSLFNVDVTNSSDKDIYYGIWYKNLTNIEQNKFSVSKLSSSSNETSGDIKSNETKTITVIVNNNSSNNLEIKIGVASDENSVKNIIYYDNRILITNVIDNYNNDANEPILDSGMIPVRYDDSLNSWVKANFNNKNNSWYDYSAKKWANVILVKDDVREYYQNVSVNSKININDVVAFYVWIPRFKYKVWNINRQTKSVDNYSYNAKDEGIQIVFERDSKNTGNVSCKYNIHTTFNNNTLSDSCDYMSNNIKYNTINGPYTDAWYTHPAFGDSLSGFWIGKFETTGNKDNPTILPDSVALTNLDLSSQFAISRKFNDYGITNGMDARIIKNVEWGAVLYLAHSVYGVCDNKECMNVYYNNSTKFYTGRSSGNNNINDVNDSGTFSYDGYIINDNNTKSSKRDFSKLASTTGNITGVYDMSGGAMEIVMSNYVTESFALNSGSSLDNWNIDKKLSEKYYELYSYVSDSSNSNSYYKTRLGDATSELTINGNPWNNVLKSLTGNKNYPWVIRGFGNNMFGYGFSNGSANEKYTFRSVIS